MGLVDETGTGWKSNIYYTWFKLNENEAESDFLCSYPNKTPTIF